MVRTDYPTPAGQRSERGRVWFLRRSPCRWTPGQRALEQRTGQAAPDLGVGGPCAPSRTVLERVFPHGGMLGRWQEACRENSGLLQLLPIHELARCCLGRYTPVPLPTTSPWSAADATSSELLL